MQVPHLLGSAGPQKLFPAGVSWLTALCLPDPLPCFPLCIRGLLKLPPFLLESPPQGSGPQPLCTFEEPGEHFQMHPCLGLPVTCTFSHNDGVVGNQRRGLHSSSAIINLSIVVFKWSFPCPLPGADYSPPASRSCPTSCPSLLPLLTFSSTLSTQVSCLRLCPLLCGLCLIFHSRASAEQFPRTAPSLGSVSF